MKTFLKNIFLFFAFSLLLFICILFCYVLKTGVTIHEIPPPYLSNSYSFNDKVLFSHNKKADILAIGSSMSLNNLDSHTIIEELNTNSYLNIGAWGLCMKDCFQLLKIYTAIHQPKTCIISSNLTDFEQKMINIKYEGLKDFLLSDTNQIYKYHLKYFNARYYSKYFGYSKIVKQQKDIYEFLGYDEYGAVLFDSLHFNKSIYRWLNPGFEKLHENQYVYLDSISIFCKSNNIQLLFFQSPFRAGLYKESVPRLNIAKINEHIQRVKKIITDNGHEFVNSNNNTWEDNLFVDGIHFNSIGAKLYTEYCFKQLKLINNKTTSKTTFN